MARVARQPEAAPPYALRRLGLATAALEDGNSMDRFWQVYDRKTRGFDDKTNARIRFHRKREIGAEHFAIKHCFQSLNHFLLLSKFEVSRKILNDSLRSC